MRPFSSRHVDDTPRWMGTGDAMTDHRQSTNPRRWATTAVAAAVFGLLIVSAAGAADRVVLGEYFTNLY